MAQVKEEKLKRRLHGFLQELAKVGCVKGFQYFTTYLRGREELIVSILNKPQVVDNAFTVADCDARRLSCGGSFISGNLPYDKRSLVLSQRSQRTLSGLGDDSVGLPPASPSDHESAPEDESMTMFLLAGYGRYSSPYVWVRSNHARLVKLSKEAEEARDSPLKLKTTSAWSEQDIHPWDILAELVKLCTYPPPLNPFSLDWDYFDQLPLADRVLASAAMASMLQKIVLAQNSDKPYLGKVMEDLELISKRHFQDVAELLKQGMLPVMATAGPTRKTGQNPTKSRKGQPSTAIKNQGQNWNTMSSVNGNISSGIEYTTMSGSGAASHSYQYKTGML